MLKLLPFIGVNTQFRENSKVSAKSILRPLQADSVSFGYDSPLKEIAEHCAYCGCEMLTEKEVEQTIGRLLNYSGYKLQKEAEHIIEMLSHSSSNNHRKEIMEEILHSSQDQPRVSGSKLVEQLLKSREIAFEDELEASKERKKEIFEKLQKMKPAQPEFTQKLIDSLIELDPALEITIINGIRLIKKKSDKEGVKLSPKFKAYCKKADKRFFALKKDKTLSIAQNSSPHELLTRLIAPLKVTMEHIHPHSKKGQDHTYNYLPVCSHCNSERSNIDFTEQLEANPQIEGFINRCLGDLKKAISSLINPPRELANYIDEVTKTLSVESEGQLNIVV